jgi:multidrug efflux pump subunit AcrA (membrane-fusion protein)
MDVKIKTDATRDEILEGKVTYVALSSTSTETASNASSAAGYGSLSSLASTFTSMTSGVASTNAKYKVKIDINTPSDRLRVGMNAKASIITDKKERVLTVPYEAVIKREDNSHYIRVVKEGYDINEAVRKLKELLNKEDDNKERETTTVQTETLENMIEEIDVNVGIEGSYYTEISSDKIKENMYVVVPEIETNNTIKELIQMMGAGAGV